MEKLLLNTQYILDEFVEQREVDYLQPFVDVAHKMLETKDGPGSEFLGWIDWPTDYDQEEYARIKEAAEKIRDNVDVFVVIGIGGSYLGAEAALHYLQPSFVNHLSREERGAPEVHFAGQNISADYLSGLLQMIGDRDFAINIISKSGTTTEPSLAFRLLKEKLEEKYGKRASEYIFATTDSSKGALREEADDKGYESFIIPDNIGGRFTVLTAVGLLPLAVAGIDIDELMEGARLAQREYSRATISDNDAYLYATLRHLLYLKGYSVEILANYDPALRQFGEWWKQLFGESEGKDRSGIFPSTANFTTDLHSMGQFIQDGKRDIFETVLDVEQSHRELLVPERPGDQDGLDYLEGQSVSWVNQKAFEATTLAHVDGGVPNIVIHLKDKSPSTLGQLFYFFEVAVAVSGYLNAVNPFNQPGVEAYKVNMFALLGKPGYEEERKALEARMKNN